MLPGDCLSIGWHKIVEKLQFQVIMQCFVVVVVIICYRITHFAKGMPATHFGNDKYEIKNCLSLSTVTVSCHPRKLEEDSISLLPP